MKLAVYNIMSGGFAAYNYDLAQPERLANIQTVLNELGADVVGLVDTFRWEETFTDQQLRGTFGYQFVACINLNSDRLRGIGHNNGLTLLSKTPWLSCETVSLGTRDALRACFKIGEQPIQLFLVYLDDASEDARLAQVERLLAQVEDVETTVIMGDLNALAPGDARQLKRDLPQFYNENPSLGAKFKPVIQDMQKGSVMRRLLKAGFIDAGRSAGPTMPTKLFPAALSRPILRIDYCLHGAKLRSNDFKVHSSAVAQAASDHFPISCEIK